jgi:hypothetical protein
MAVMLSSAQAALLGERRHGGSDRVRGDRGRGGVAAMTSPASSRIATPSRRVMRGPILPAGMQSRDRRVIAPVSSWYPRG